MFLKIKLRSLLLKSFEKSRFGTNPYKLHPLAHYVYYDALNAWLPVLKQMKKAGASDVEMLEKFVMNSMQGYCPNKFYKAATSGESYKMEDMIDSNLVNQVNILCDGNEDLRNMMIGCSAFYRY
tara:strand:- start:4402 stop:4773 length:372 start_codon:yes stop_codon:yes gene_type:complete